jgi:hypothetical protein
MTSRLSGVFRQSIIYGLSQAYGFLRLCENSAQWGRIPNNWSLDIPPGLGYVLGEARRHRAPIQARLALPCAEVVGSGT